MREGYDPQYGARPMRRAVEKHMEDPLAELVLKGDAPEGTVIAVSFDEEGKKLKFTPADPDGKEPEKAAVSDGES